MFGRIWNATKSFFFCSTPREVEEITPQEMDRRSTDILEVFSHEFAVNYSVQNKAESSLKLWDKNLFNACHHARLKRLPILIMILPINDRDRLFESLCAFLHQHAQSLQEDFLCLGFSTN
jgi:hypothetical protein